MKANGAVETPRLLLDALTEGTVHQGVVAWAPDLELIDFAQLLGEPELLGIVLDGISDPQNFGAVVRSAVGIAGAVVIWGEHASAPLSLATFRASAGAVAWLGERITPRLLVASMAILGGVAIAVFGRKRAA